MHFYDDGGRLYELGEKLGQGGVGIVYKVIGLPSKVAKIFKNSERDRDEKISILRRLQWTNECKESIALPQILLYDKPNPTGEQLRGFIMENFGGTCCLTDVYLDHPLSVYKRAVIALNLCKIVNAVHTNPESFGGHKGSLLLGDFNFNNIRIDKMTGDVRILDCDSFHITIKTKNTGERVYPCKELYPDFFPPEINNLIASMGRPKPTLEQLHENGYKTFTLYTDYFCLAFHIHNLLLGCGPFSCALDPSEVAGKKSVHMPSDATLKRDGNYCYTNLSSRMRLPDYCLDFDVITPRLQNLFIRAFQDGAKHPEKRPTASEFIVAIEEYIGSLRFVNCQNNWIHYLREGLKPKYCPWCKADEAKSLELTFNAEDIRYATNQELKRIIELKHRNVSKNIKAEVMIELGKRMDGSAEIVQRGCIANPKDKKEARKYYQNAIKLATSEKLRTDAESRIKKL